ncbi:TPA: ERF family protein, partial [Morganella morganii]
MKKEFFQKIADIQQKLKAPKNLNNSFGNYSYRSCEGILEAVKPLLDGLVLS